MLGERGVRARRHLGQQCWLLGRADPGRLAGAGPGRHLAQLAALPPAQQRRPVDAEEGGDLAHRAAGVELPQGTFAAVAGGPASSPKCRPGCNSSARRSKALTVTRSLRSLAADFGVSHETVRAVLQRPKRLGKRPGLTGDRAVGIMARQT